MSRTVLQKIWCKVYSNGPHFSTVEKAGYTCYVPESLALALFLRRELDKAPDPWVMALTNRVGELNGVLEKILENILQKKKRRKSKR